MERLSREEALELLENQPVAHLGVVRDGRSYVTPMSFVLDGEVILFRTMAGEKLDAIKANPFVCIEVSSYDEASGDWVSAIVSGEASEVLDDDVKAKTTSLLFSKYADVLGSPLSRGGGMRPLQGFPHVIQVVIEEISGMTAGSAWSARTRPGRL